MKGIRKNKLVCYFGAALVSMTSNAAWAATPTVWTTSIDAATYSGSYGTITFNDWGYVGPAGVGANDFQVGGGFNSANLGQIQHVVTKPADWLTPDPGHDIVGDLTNTPSFPRASMDNNVNFYLWGYTTPANSTFSNMQIDRAGNYYIAKNDMAFGFYDRFQYHDTGVNPSTGLPKPDTNYDTKINFQPYAISDAKGWCGSTLVTNPNGVEVMAGQVTFDFAFDAYFENPSTPSAPGTFSSTQLVPGFVMRSYGDYSVNVTTVEGDAQVYEGHAVGNNTNPESVVPGVGGTLDPAYQNQVSFLGAGVVPNGVWTSADSYNADGSRKMRTSCNQTTGECTQVWDVTIVATGTPGAIWHSNSFAGYAYLLRADGTRTLDYIAPSHSEYVPTELSAVPVPAAIWLFGSGLLGVMGTAWRKNKVKDVNF